ncbi:MAG TPA: hypothetical protein VIR55_13660 [Ignavibacteria bacterium]
MKNRIFVLFVLFCININFLVSQSDYEKSYRKRADSVIEYYKKLPFRVDAFRAMVKLNKGYDIPTALQIIDSLTYNPKGDMFWFYPAVALYCYGKDNMPPEYKAKMRQAFKNYTPNRGDTENHWMMYYTSLYLISQEFPGEDGSTWFNGKSSEENFKDAEGWLNFWMKTTSTIGQGEFDSPIYGIWYVTPLYLLYQFSKDPVMKKKAEIMLTWVIADFLEEYYDGVYTGAHSRLYPYDIFVKRKSQMSFLAAYLLGDRPLFYPDGSPYNLQYNSPIYALSDYVLPEIVAKIAKDRSTPYEVKEIKRSRNRIRYYDERNPIVAKYNYVNPDYAMGCVQIGWTEEILQHTWSLDWKSVKKDEVTTFFTIQPYYFADDMCSLFPEYKKYIVAGVVSSKTEYDKETKVVGSSPFEKLFQYKNTMIGLYDLTSERVKYKEYVGFFPKDLLVREEDPSGWIFCKANSVYFAFLPLKPYSWAEDKDVFRLISTDQKNGFILEVKGVNEIKSFEEFKSRIKKNKVIKTNFDKNMKISYTNLDGITLEFSYDGLRKVNGNDYLPLKYKLFDNPFMQAEVGGEKMIIQYKGEKLILDVKNAQMNYK